MSATTKNFRVIDQLFEPQHKERSLSKQKNERETTKVIPKKMEAETNFTDEDPPFIETRKSCPTF